MFSSSQNGSVTPLAKPRESAKLVWNSKPRREPNPRDLEFQPAEVVFPNRAAGQTELLVPRTSEGEVDDSKLNRLIWGDNLLTMQALLSQGYEGKFRLIYIDPPFNTNENFNFQTSMRLGDRRNLDRPISLLERLAYNDRWQNGVDSYLDMLLPRIQLMRRLLSDDGSIFVHIGPDMVHYVRVILDETFGKSSFQNQITWQRTTAHSDPVRLGMICDFILYYSKSSKRVWNPVYIPYSGEYIESHYSNRDSSGDQFMWDNLTNPHPGGYMYKLLGSDPPINGWRMPEETAQKWVENGKIGIPLKGKVPRFKRYLKDMPGVPLQDLWTDIPPINSQAKEDTGFETQKPEALLHRIIAMASNPGDLIGDFFSGSGTTAVVAEKLGRRWVISDLGKVGIQVARTRLVNANASPFVLENIGNYQRELIYKEGGNIALMQRIVMKLFGAEPHPAHTDLGVMHGGGKKTLVYVGYPDRPLTAKKTAELVKIARSLDGEGYDKLVLLAWDYEYNYDEGIEVRRKGFGVQVEPRLIPPSIYEYLRKSKNEDDLIEKFAKKIQFGAKPYLKIATPKVTDRGGGEHNIAVSIERYVLSEIPVEDEEDRIELQKLSAGDGFAVLIDYWAVDWDYDGKTFRSRWQDFRSGDKEGRPITTRANTTLNESRRFDIAVRVVDVFGNDATATTSVDLR